MRAKKPQTGRRTFAQQIALAERIGTRAQIDALLKKVAKMDVEIAKLNKKIANTQNNPFKKQDLINQILKKNSQRSQYVLRANSIHESNQKN